MFPYEFYKVLHLIGLIMVFFGFGGILIAGYARVELVKSARMMGMIAHGVGLLIMFVSGFGLAARMGMMSGLPGWVKTKIVIWLLLGGGIAVAKRKGYIGWPVAILIWGLGATAAYLAVNKPF